MIKHHHLSSAYQPILSPTHQKLVGYEALIRASDRRGQPVSPPALFAEAARQGCSAQLDRHLLHQHVAHCPVGPDPAWLFLNIHPDSCTRPDTSLDELALQCEAGGIAPDRIVLEFVETASEHPEALLNFIHRARARGFQVAIDDFGVGDSNFERLWRIQPLIVKLDRSLLLNAESHRRARLLLESLVKMIRESGSLVLLEGIETPAQAQLALATDADLLQGFLFGQPGPVTEEGRAQAEQRLRETVARSQDWWQQNDRDQEGYLTLLRYEMMEAGHRVVRDLPFAEACAALLGLDGVKRCFVLDHRGVQLGRLARANPDRQQIRFNPLYESSGACWAHRDYFQRALEHPQRIHCSRPYVGLPDARRTVTLSTALPGARHRRVLCVDIHPDDLFDGHLTFPASL
ncbi:sensor domain-containing phosphodiesterase [Marinobacter sp. C2H3]|uniref:sensor domain-containing phosphodiesterase n=1 Tax=Marinobacter sp. C2H3 TaxID=3119003 RepID=UPI00300EA669